MLQTALRHGRSVSPKEQPSSVGQHASGNQDLTGNGYERYVCPVSMIGGHGRLDVAQLLLAAGAAVDARDEWDCTALHTAAGQGNMEAVQLLLNAGARVQAFLFICTQRVIYLCFEMSLWHDSLAVWPLHNDGGAGNCASVARHAQGTSSRVTYVSTPNLMAITFKRSTGVQPGSALAQEKMTPCGPHTWHRLFSGWQ